MEPDTEEHCENIKIRVACRGVKNQEIAIKAHLHSHKSSTIIHTSKATPNSNSRVEFEDPIVLNYSFQCRQRLTLEVYDASEGGGEEIGKAEFTVGEVYSRQEKGVTKQLEKCGKIMGEMHLKCSKIDRAVEYIVEFDIMTDNLSTGIFFFKQHQVYWKLFKIRNNTEHFLYESQKSKGKYLSYKRFVMAQSKLCDNDPNQPLILKFYRDDSDNKPVGQMKFSLAMLLKVKKYFSLMKGDKKKSTVVFSNVKKSIRYPLTDFLASGMKIKPMVCIDFTGSNGIYTDINSLHYYTQEKRSLYEQALTELCPALLDYSADKTVPCFGFGAKVSMPTYNSNNSVQHCFPLNGSEQNPNLHDFSDISETYRRCLPDLQFSGPTYLGRLLSKAIKLCESIKKERVQYLILVVLTDGVNHDESEVRYLLAEYNDLPMSVVIIGIGDADWSTLGSVKAYQNLWHTKASEENQRRRTVKIFKEFNRYNKNGVQVASAVLGELQPQIEEYHQMFGVHPKVYRKIAFKEAMMQFLLEANEDFDDDLLQDAVELLFQPDLLLK